VGLFVISFGLLAAGIFVLTAIERREGRLLNHMFEVTSGINTVGLSMGETPTLNPAGRLLLILLMFFGRIGPLTLAASIAIRQFGRSNFRYAYEDVVVG
jgi:trk system potassium uptake protein